MTAPVKLCVVGSLNKDLVVRTPRLPAPGETLLGGPFATFDGGKGANQAIAAARLGATVSMVGRVGDDVFGGELVRALSVEGIDVSAVRVVEGTSTGVASIVVEEGGENTIVVASGANGKLRPADVSTREGTDAAWLLAQNETPPETVAAAIEHAHANGVRTALNAAPARELDERVLHALDVLVVNREEARALGANGSDARDSARSLRANGPPCVVVTLGSDGAVAADAEGEYEVAAFAVDARDAVGAGDAFTAAFVVALAERRAVAEALRFANAAGALATLREGAQVALPRRDEVEAFLRETSGH